MAKQASLAAKTGEVQKAEASSFTMPAIFQQPFSPVQSRAWAPQVVFAHMKRLDEWKKLTAKFGDISEGEMFFIYGERLERLTVAKMALVICKQYWASKQEGTGNLLAVSDKEMPKPFNEHIQAVVLVYFDDRVYPANVEFRTTKCPGGKALYDALIEASDPAWADKSPAHRETLSRAQPIARYYGELKLGDPRPSKTSGLPYRPLTCTVKPTTPTEWKLFDALATDPETSKLMDLCANRFQQKLKELEPKMIAS